MRRLVSNIAAVLLAVGVTAGAAEVAVRAFHLAPAVDADGMIAPPHEFDWDETSNARGWHDVEHAEAKPPGVERVLVLGDSYVEARHVPRDSTFTRLLERRLRERSGYEVAAGGMPNDSTSASTGIAAGSDAATATSPSIEVIAIGHRGWSQREELAALEREGLAYHPDLVLLCFLGFNDVSGNSGELRARGKQQEETLLAKRPGQTRTSLASLPLLVAPASHLNRALSYRLALLSARLEPVLHRDRPAESTIPVDYLVFCDVDDPAWHEAWAETESLVVAIRDRVEAAGARLLLVSLPMPQQSVEDGVAQLTRAYPALAQLEPDLGRADSLLAGITTRHAIERLALAPSFRDRARRANERLHFPVNGHWNEAGHRFAAELIGDYLIAKGLAGRRAQS
jgi:hypothetical protein